MLQEAYLQHENISWENLFQNRSVQEGMFSYLRKTWFAFTANSRRASGLTQKQGSAGKLPPFMSFTELAPTINNKCFSPVTWQVDGAYRISRKSGMENSSNIWYTELPKASRRGWTGMRSDINQLLREKIFST